MNFENTLIEKRVKKRLQDDQDGSFIMSAVSNTHRLIFVKRVQTIKQCIHCLFTCWGKLKHHFSLISQTSWCEPTSDSVHQMSHYRWFLFLFPTVSYSSHQSDSLSPCRMMSWGQMCLNYLFYIQQTPREFPNTYDSSILRGRSGRVLLNFFTCNVSVHLHFCSLVTMLWSCSGWLGLGEHYIWASSVCFDC